MTYYERNKEKIKKYQKEYCKEYRKTDRYKKLKKIQDKRYRLNNPEKIKERNKINLEKRRIKNGIKPRLNLSPEKRRQIKLERMRQYSKKRRLKLRVEVFTRDNFSCVICGRKPPQITLEIDHKYPKSKKGLNDINNYQTLCKDCNVGKGDSILSEFTVNFR